MIIIYILLLLYNCLDFLIIINLNYFVIIILLIFSNFLFIFLSIILIINLKFIIIVHIIFFILIIKISIRNYSSYLYFFSYINFNLLKSFYLIYLSLRMIFINYCFLKNYQSLNLSVFFLTKVITNLLILSSIMTLKIIN